MTHHGLMVLLPVLLFASDGQGADGMNRGSFSTTFGGAPADCPELTLTLELREGRLKGEYVGPAARSFSARSQIDNDGIQAEFQRGRCAYVVTVRRKLAI